MSKLWVTGIVAGRDFKPYVQIASEKGEMAQMSLSEARQFANDIVIAASRVEADAMILEFFKKAEFPEGAGAALMVDFRDFRYALDMDKAERPGGEPSV
jgi:hypothetical protein